MTSTVLIGRERVVDLNCYFGAAVWLLVNVSNRRAQKTDGCYQMHDLLVTQSINIT